MSGVDSAISAALAQIGTPYRWGAEVPGAGFDCSGFVQYSYGKAGISVPRTAAAQQAATKTVSVPLIGDLVFYGKPAHHVGLYLGNGKMIAAPHTGDVVKIQSVYSAGDGPTYGRVTGAGIASTVSAVTGAVRTVANTSTGTGITAGLSAALGSAQDMAYRGGFVLLGLVLAGAGVYVAVKGKG